MEERPDDGDALHARRAFCVCDLRSDRVRDDVVDDGGGAGGVPLGDDARELLNEDLDRLLHLYQRRELYN